MNDSLRLLVVEDDPIDQRALQRLIQRAQLNYECTMVASPDAARAALHQSDFDVVILDYQLGDGTGFDVIESVNDTPVIFITGMGSEEVAVHAMKAGAFDYLTKDSERHYLELLPTVVENTIKRHAAEQHAQELELERMRRDILSTFLRDISHDLRTPLANLGTSIYLLSRYVDQLVTLTFEAPDRTDEIRQQVTRIQDRTAQVNLNRAHLEQIITDMIEMVKADQLTELQTVAYDLNALTQQVMEEFVVKAQENDQTLRYEPAPNALYAQLAVQEFALIITHLVKNALEYTLPGGTITVCTYASDGYAYLCVNDTGIGIAPEDLPRIFERFFRVNKARTMNANGTGIGLAIVRRLVELHGGTIEVSSTPGQGSMFRVRLPCS